MKISKGIIRWSLAIGWMLFIFYMSHQPGDISSSQSKIILDIFNFFGVRLDEYWSSVATFVVRKLAHFTEYYILFILVYNAIGINISDKRKYIYSLIATFLYASSDEIHQYFIPGRCMSIKDVLIDTSGGVFAMLSVMFIKFKNKK